MAAFVEQHHGGQSLRKCPRQHHDAPTLIRTGLGQPPSPQAARARSAMDAFNTRISEVRPDYIATARVAEFANFVSFNDGLSAPTMRRLDVLLFELDRYLSGVARPKLNLAPELS